MSVLKRPVMRSVLPGRTETGEMRVRAMLVSAGAAEADGLVTESPSIESAPRHVAATIADTVLAMPVRCACAAADAHVTSAGHADSASRSATWSTSRRSSA